MTQSWPSWLPIRPDLSGLSPYGAPQIDVPTRLNTNENPYSLSDELQTSLNLAITKELENLNRYPDRDAKALRIDIARAMEIETGVRLNEDWIWAANGSNEIIQSILLAFEGAALGFEPSYSMHPLITKVVGKKWISIARDENFEIGKAEVDEALASSEAKIVFLTSPNNPTGTSTSIKQIEELAKSLLGNSALLVVDEAYGEFSREKSAVTLLSDCPNILVSRTMSKAFAFAGARLGYLIADPKVIAAIQLVRLPYHLSSLTQAAARAAIANQVTLKQDVKKLIEARETLISELRSLGLEVYPSDANFILFGGFNEPEAQLWRALLDKGVLIRDVGLSGTLRVTIGTPDENRVFLSALRERVRG